MATIRLNRMIDAPVANSREMRAYMQAMLEVTGLMAGESFPLELFMGNYRTHLQPKEKYPHACLKKDGFGNYSLTAPGIVFFSSRLTDSPIIASQSIGRDEVIEKIKEIVALQPSTGWEQFSLTR